MNLRTLLAAAAFLGLSASAALAQNAYSTGNVNMRAGPGTQYPRVTTIPTGSAVDVHGCLSGWNWCDTSWRGLRGWVSGNYLQMLYNNRRVLVPEYGPRIGVPIITFQFGNYWDRWYRDRPWSRDRHRWDDRRDRDRDRWDPRPPRPRPGDAVDPRPRPPGADRPWSPRPDDVRPPRPDRPGAERPRPPRPDRSGSERPRFPGNAEPPRQSPPRVIRPRPDNVGVPDRPRANPSRDGRPSTGRRG